MPFCASRLFLAASASVELTVPGSAQGIARPGHLDTIADADVTRFHIALGGAGLFELRWRVRRTTGDGGVIETGWFDSDWRMPSP